MKSTDVLPEGYREIYEIDLQKNKRAALLVNGLALLIAAALVVPVLFAVPIKHFFNPKNLGLDDVIRYLVMAVGIIVYIILHELVHGIAMKLCGTKKVKYGFTGMYAFAGSDDYYGKGSYIFIALAPVVLWGAVLAVVSLFVPLSWFWVVHFVQVVNLSGAAGDLFVTVKFSRFPKDILVRDHGVGMRVYSKQ